MLVKNQMVDMRWHPSNKKWFVEKGYHFTKMKDCFKVKVTDLMPSSKTVVKVECDYCKQIYETTFGVYYNGLKAYPKCACAKCAAKKAQDINKDDRQKKYFNKISEICNKQGYTLLSKKEDCFDIRNNKISYICSKHGRQENIISNFLQGHYCYFCGNENIGKKLRNSIEDIENEINGVNGNILLNKEEYIDANTPNLQIKCGRCGNVHITSYSNYKRLLFGCPTCGLEHFGKSKRLDFNDVEKRINLINNNVLLNKNEYIGNNITNLKIKCGCCNENIFITSLANYLSGKITCSSCSKKKSRQERKIEEFLVNNNIIFEEEKRFDDCRDKRPLPFDFYLPDRNTCIEYDGEGHYLERFYEFKSNNPNINLEITKYHDNIKNEYCKKKKIKLIRIPYWEKNNITEILNKKLILNT